MSRACIKLLDNLEKKSCEKILVATYPYVSEVRIPLPLSLVEAVGLEVVLAGTSFFSSDPSSATNSSSDSSLSSEPIVSNFVSSANSVTIMGCFPFVATLAFCYSVGS